MTTRKDRGSGSFLHRTQHIQQKTFVKTQKFFGHNGRRITMSASIFGEGQRYLWISPEVPAKLCRRGANNPQKCYSATVFHGQNDEACSLLN
jgi:hypothetical protein